MKYFNCLILSIVIFHSSLQGWFHSGHKIAAQIAYQHLHPETKTEVDGILNTLQPLYPNHCNFVDASTWADDIRYEGINLFDTCHYTNIPYDPENILSLEKKAAIAEKNSGRDVVFLINSAIKTLSNRSSSPFAKALMLQLLIHTVADIHQPLHCSSRYSVKHPEGDQGGNLFRLPRSNLHMLWDSGLGAFPKTNDSATIQHFAASLMNAFPPEYFPELSILDAAVWSLEGHMLAETIAYQTPEDSQPSEEYIRMAQETARERITLAGYRLASLLNQVL